MHVLNPLWHRNKNACVNHHTVFSWLPGGGLCIHFHKLGLLHLSRFSPFPFCRVVGLSERKTNNKLVRNENTGNLFSGEFLARYALARITESVSFISCLMTTLSCKLKVKGFLSFSPPLVSHNNKLLVFQDMCNSIYESTIYEYFSAKNL